MSQTSGRWNRRGGFGIGSVVLAALFLTTPVAQAQQASGINGVVRDSSGLALPGATKARLRPDESGFENVTLTGDWTRNGLNVGCVEATVMSGMLASSAISGYPLREDIIGADGP